MYINYGDKNFWKYGCLVDSEHSDTCFDILYCNPICDEDDLYYFGNCQVDITDTWIDRNVVLHYIGMTEDTFDAVQFAVGCIEYYGIANFCSPPIYYSRAEIEQILKHKIIANDNLEITW